MSITDQRPNIIWIFGDQHRAQSLSIAGDPNLSTPNLDRMAIEGLYFPKAVANNPWCCPFRWMAMTGKYSHRGVYKTPMPMKPTDRTIAHYLGESGYRTHYVGKWHLSGSNSSQEVPMDLRGGFDTWLGYENNNNQYYCKIHGHDENGGISERRLHKYETDELTDIFIDRIHEEANRADGPFFAVLSVQPPHTPNLAPEEDMARHRPGEVKLRPNVPPVPWIEDQARTRLAGYHAQIENLDANVGRIYRALEKDNMLDDTYVFFFADHGDCMGAHGFFEKSSHWEESIRIPFMIGGGIPHMGFHSGARDEQISAVDITPTTLGLAGLDVPQDMDGYDYSPMRRNEPLKNPPDSVYCQHLVRKQLKDGFDRPWRTVITNDNWKYTCMPNAPVALFNLNDDPYEMANLAFNTRFMEQRKRCHERLRRWIEETGDEFELPEL